MLELEVLNVEIGAKYQGKIYDYWILGKLNSKKQIKIFDLFGYDLRNQINRKVECAIQPCILYNETTKINLNKPYIKGIFVHKVFIPSNWIRCEKTVGESNWYGVQNEDGIFFIHVNDLQVLNLKKGDFIEFNVGRFDLLAWYNK